MSILYIRETNGSYRPATTEQAAQAIQQQLTESMRSQDGFTNPSAVADYLRTCLAPYEREVFAVIYLDSQNRAIGDLDINVKGTIDSASVYPREIAKEALMRNARSVILSHNHPSGTPEPSLADRAITDRIKGALSLLDTRVLDHIVVASQGTVSFADRGWI